jgi:hypothetical protein
MKELTNLLLKKVKSSVLVRESDPDAYLEAFRQAETFITATINGQLEFVPMELMFINNNKYQILLEVNAVFGSGMEHAQLDDLLIKFYNDHDLKRDIDSISDSVRYHVKPQAQSGTVKAGLFDWEKLGGMSEYAGIPYRASDESLKTIGQSFADSIMHPTNEWAGQIVPADYVLEKERYWQVAGNFKSFTWAKLKHNTHQDIQIFFSVGVDIRASKIIIKLDCLRSGTHKLSNYDIRKFDYYTERFNCVTEIGSEIGEVVGWDSILNVSREFIKDFEPVYLGVVNYIWGSKIDLDGFNNKVFSVKHEEIKKSGKHGEPLPEILYNTVLDSVIRYEQYMLSHADKDDLAALVKFTFDDLCQINSFEFDGQHKQIYVVANTGSVATLHLKLLRNYAICFCKMITPIFTRSLIIMKTLTAASW